MAIILIIVFIIILTYICFSEYKNEPLISFVGYDGTKFEPNNQRDIYPYWGADAYNK
jgi:hypothetical protein